MINNVILVGRTTKDMELKRTTTGIANVQFTLAVNRPFKTDDGKQSADFIQCVAWDKQAENASKYVKKGMLIGVEGRIQTRSYDDDSGRRHYVTEIVGQKITFLESKKTVDPGPEVPSYYQQQEMKPNPFDSNFATSPSQNYSNPFATATTMAGNRPPSNPLINIQDEDLPF